MSGENAVTWGYNPSLGADQYWQMYMQYSQALDKQRAISAQNTGNTPSTDTATTVTGSTGTAFKANPQGEEKSHFWRNTAIFVSGAALILAGVAANKGGGIMDAFKGVKVSEGFKKLWENTKKGFGIMKNSITEKAEAKSTTSAT